VHNQRPSNPSNLIAITRKRSPKRTVRFLTATTALKPIRVWSLKQEIRSVQAAEDEHATMVETNERSHLRKAIAELAREITS